MNGFPQDMPLTTPEGRHKCQLNNIKKRLSIYPTLTTLSVSFEIFAAVIDPFKPIPVLLSLYYYTTITTIKNKIKKSQPFSQPCHYSAED